MFSNHALPSRRYKIRSDHRRSIAAPIYGTASAVASVMANSDKSKQKVILKNPRARIVLDKDEPRVEPPDDEEPIIDTEKWDEANVDLETLANTFPHKVDSEK